jgi:hypothetical protein
VGVSRAEVLIAAYDAPVSTPTPFATYRYVADGSLTSGPISRRSRALRNPLLLVAFVAFGLAFGLFEAFATYSESTSQYFGRIVRIGLWWGLYWIVFTAALMAALVAVLRWRERRRLRRLFPAGSTTEVTVTADDLVIAGPTGARTISFERMTVVKTLDRFLVICLRSMRSELIPIGVLSEEAVAYVSARAQGVWPAADQPTQGEDVRTFVVPDGWAGHLATVYTRFALARRGFLVRFGLTAVVVALIALALDPWWLLLGPALLGVIVVGLYGGTRRNALRAVPSGSIATLELLEDGFISRNASGSRETRYADVHAFEVRGDVALVRTSARSWRLMALALFPDDIVERMRQVATGR